MLHSELRAAAPLGSWIDCARVYAPYRACERQGISLREAAELAGFETLEAFEETLRRHCESGSVGALDRGMDSHAVIELMAATWHRPPSEQERAPPPSAVVDQTEARAFDAIWEAYEPLAFRVARATLSEDEARELALEVLGEIALQGPELWRSLDERYVVTATRNRVANRLRWMSRQPRWVGLDDVPHLAAAREQPHRELVRALEEERLRNALLNLHPRRATAWWLRKWLRWPRTDTEALLDLTPKSLEHLLGRARKDLQRWFDADSLRR